MTSLRRLAGLVVLECLIWATPARADVVADWNAIATQMTLTRPGPSSLLDFASVHAAMHDAIQAYDGRFEPYAVAIPNASGSPIAAAATAAHDVLAARLPLTAAQLLALDNLLNTYLAGLGLLGDAGMGVGREAAVGIINLRVGDGSFPANPEVFTGGTRPGEWRPTLPAFAPMVTPWFGKVDPFTLRDPTQLRALLPPPHLRSSKYAREYNEVKALGGMVSTARTQEQTALALFYSDNLIAQWQRTLRGIAEENVDNIGDSARLFALANMAAADAFITAWADKRAWNFWRPITAIQEGDNDGNPNTAGDTNWRPLLNTPAYPEYTSGANNLAGAMTRTLERIFGDKTTFSVFSTPANLTKTYHRFSDLADDMVEVRIYQGIHFRSGDEVARRQGTRAADWAIGHFLRHSRPRWK